MIQHWKRLDLEVTDLEYYHDPTPSAGTIPSQTSNPQTGGDCKCSKYF